MSEPGPPRDDSRPEGPRPPAGYPPAGYPPAGYPPGAAGPTASTTGARHKRSKAPIVFAVLAVFVLVVAGVTAVVVLTTTRTANAEVFLSAADQPGPDPFTTEAPVPPIPTTTVKPAGEAATLATGSAGAPVTVSGATTGLYGGTLDASRCDREQLARFFDANPGKAAAFIGALESDPSFRWSGGTLFNSRLGAYLAELTPVTLVTDTNVTNHGWDGRWYTSTQAVLQAGTAVLVDSYGVPRVKCDCGNPLTGPKTISSPIYRGTQWPAFDPIRIIVVQQTTVVINTFVLTNTDGSGTTIDRPAGSAGTKDTSGSATTSTSTTPSGPSTTVSASTTTTSRATTTAPSSVPTPSTRDPALVAWCKKLENFLTVQGSPPQLAAVAQDLAATAPPSVKADAQIIADWQQRAADRAAANQGLEVDAATMAARDRAKAACA